MTTQKYQTIIVGGGIAGLTAAAYLARGNKKVLLIEKNAECGGLVNSFKRNGFHFDAGLRALESAGVIFPMLEDLGIELESVKSPVSIGIGDDILHIKDLSSLNDYKALLQKLYPESKDDIEKTIQDIRKIMKHMDVLYGIENPVFKDLNRDRKFIFKKLLPWLPKFIFTVGKINRMRMPVEDYLATRIQDPSLRDIIAQHFFKSTPTFFALSYFSLYLDYFYPRGGVGKLAEVVENKVLEGGGEILRKKKIVEVVAAKKLLRDDEGNGYHYEQLIWAADLKTMYRSIDPAGLAENIRSKFEDSKKTILARRGGDSVFSIFLQVDEPLESFQRIANGHFFYTPSKVGLGETHRAELDQLLNNWETTDKKQVEDWMDRFTRLNTYEISIPGLKDPTLAPKGKTGIIVSFLAEYDLFRAVQEAGWYQEFKGALEEAVCKVLADSVYPMLHNKLIAKFSFSPISIENRVGSSEGAITGWSFQKPVPVIDKIQIADRSVFTPIPSIFQAGQWAYSPAGVPMSILTGKMAADRVLKQKKV